MGEKIKLADGSEWESITGLLISGSLESLTYEIRIDDEYEYQMLRRKKQKENKMPEVDVSLFSSERSFKELVCRVEELENKLMQYFSEAVGRLNRLEAWRKAE